MFTDAALRQPKSMYTNREIRTTIASEKGLG